MSTFLAHTAHLTGRSVRAMLRQPAFVVVTLIQPMIWLLLFGQLFSAVVALPGFGTSSYLEFLAPGVVIMTVLFASGWSGMALIDDIDRGVMDRMLASAVRKGAVVASSTAYNGVSTVVQSLVVVLVAVLCGARFAGGAVGVAVVLLAAVLLAAAFGSLSNGMALLVRTRESLIGFNHDADAAAVVLSSAIISADAAPGWIRAVSAWNPSTGRWSPPARRSRPEPDWSAVGWRLRGLAAVALVLGALATGAFRSYQRSA
jgi:ABC-2 type transport system permease protein